MKLLLTFLWVVLLFAGCCYADEDVPGECPQVAPVSGFDLEKFAAGKWFLVEQSDNDNDRCVAMEISTSPSNVIHKTGLENDNDAINKMVPFTTATAGVFSVADGSETDDYVILSTDYDRYAVVYECDHDVSDNEHEVELWIYVRGDFIENSSSVVSDAKAAITEKGVAINRLHSVDQTNCNHSL